LITSTDFSFRLSASLNQNPKTDEGLHFSASSFTLVFQWEDKHVFICSLRTVAGLCFSCRSVSL
jgi:hypothetical protein